MKTGIIYKATSPSGKSYIGKTIQNFKRRIQRHYRDSNKYSYCFARAIKKYGVKNWVWEILYDNVPLCQLNNMETWCIANHDTYYSGYNSTLGGENNPSYDPAIRAKISASSLGRKHTKEWKENMSGKNNPMYGKVSPRKGSRCSQETRDRISKALMGRKLSDKHKGNISISHRKGEQHHFSKLTWEIVDEIREKYGTGEYTHRKLAKEYSISKSTIGCIVSNKTWVR